MYGWIHTCLEHLILTRFNDETWQKIKLDAKCTISNGGFCRYSNYTDTQTKALIEASSKVLEIDMDTLLEIYGEYFMIYVLQDELYYNIFTMMGTTDLRDWLHSVNDIHTHLSLSLPDANFAEFWCTDDDAEDGIHESMLFYYHTKVS